MEHADKRQTMLERATKTTTLLTGMPRGGGATRDHTYVGLAMAGMQLSEWQRTEEENKKKLISFLRESPLTERRRRIMYARYIQLMGWKEIERQLPLWNFPASTRTVYYEHNASLRQLADWVNNTSKFKQEITGL